MFKLDRIRPQPDDRLAFFQGFLRRPQQVGSVIPSSRFMERRLVGLATAEAPKVVVELGPGTGGTTRALLRAMPPGSQLLAIEISPDFAALLQRIPDPRLIVHHGSAEQLAHSCRCSATWPMSEAGRVRSMYSLRRSMIVSRIPPASPACTIDT